MCGSEKEGGVRILSPGEFKFLKFSRNVLNIFFFRKYGWVRGVQTLFPGKFKFIRFTQLNHRKKPSGSAHAQVLVYKEGKIFIPFFNLPKNQITCTCNNRRHTVLSIIHFLYECQCKWGCMEKLETWSVHYSFR